MTLKMAYEPHDYCGICPYFKDVIFHETHQEFQENNHIHNLLLCGFFVFPVRLTLKEYEEIPGWCPLDGVEG